VLIASVTKLFGGGSTRSRGQVHWRRWAGSWRLAARRRLGIFVLNRLPPGVREHALQRGLGAVLVSPAWPPRPAPVRGQVRATATPAAWLDGGLGFVTGLLVSTTSIGSGSLLLCVLAFFFPSRADDGGHGSRTRLILSAVGHARPPASGRVDVALAASVLAGSVPGVSSGPASRMRSGAGLRAVLAVILIGLGLPIAWPGAFSHVQAG
jgi:uncharacterized membrane protein YfcA